MDSILLAVIMFLTGIVLLFKCSDWLVDGSSKTASYFSISPMIISVVIIAFGTSAPEFAISVGAAAQGEPSISLGNIVGSCVANLLLVLGIAAIIRPVKIERQVIHRELPILLGVTVLLFVFSFIGLLDEYHFIGGIIFALLFILFVWYFIQQAKKERAGKEKPIEVGSVRRDILLIIIGIVGVVAGAWLLIDSSVVIAEALGIPTFVIALSLVAIGTSLPELVVSAMAAYKKEDDIAVGNVLGSNVFNILLVLGVSAFFLPLGAMENMREMVFLLIVTVLAFPVLYKGLDINRFEGALMLVAYGFFNYMIFFM